MKKPTLIELLAPTKNREPSRVAIKDVNCPIHKRLEKNGAFQKL